MLLRIRIRYNRTMAETLRGITYPTSGDNIAPLETHFASLAGTADDAIGVVQEDLALVNADLQDFKTQVSSPASGSFSFAAPTSTSTAVNITVTLPSGYFSLAPLVVACISGPSDASPYTATIHTVTASQFQAKIVRISGSTAQTLGLNWIAI
jgi:hypothetical protein